MRKCAAVADTLGGFEVLLVQTMKAIGTDPDLPALKHHYLSRSREIKTIMHYLLDHGQANPTKEDTLALQWRIPLD